MNQVVASSFTTAEAIFKSLHTDAGNDRRRESLARLKYACDSLIEKGSPLKLSNVQRTIEAKFGRDAGPKAQSISNERKRTLGMYHYLEALERECKAKKSAYRTNAKNNSEDAISRAIDRIVDIDVRSTMHDIHDQKLVAEMGLKRAKSLFKTLNPGFDVEKLLSGQQTLGNTGLSGITAEMKLALCNIVEILTDNQRLDFVGLSFDGRRVRRKAGTMDEMVDSTTLANLKALSALFAT